MHIVGYPLAWGLGTMEEWYPETRVFHLLSIVKMMPDVVQKWGVPNYWNYFMAGPVMGTDNSMGLNAVRAYRVQQLQPWKKRFGIDVTGWSKQKIDTYLMNPELNIWEEAAALRHQIDYVASRQAAGQDQKYPNFGGFGYKSSFNTAYDPLWSPAWAPDVYGKPGFGDYVDLHTGRGRKGNGIFEVDFLHEDWFGGSLPALYRLVIETHLFSPGAEPPLHSPTRARRADYRSETGA